ncbi:unnamed protein product [Clavelina lepadiformis]|uniref:Major facilitator superfamily (MFS) profile domain-containing protein n=1 Tax=Clavelina lepadiformis TaxID=159417 RepID=A0ABP0G0T8_CLALP
MDAETAFHFVGNFGRYQIFLTSFFFLANVVSGMQMVLMVIVGATPNTTIESEMNLTTIVTDFNLYEEKWITDLIQSLYMAGYLVGCFAFGQASDIYGRKPILMLTGILTSIAAFCAGFASSWQTFAVARVFVGLFIGGCGVALFVLMTELLGKKMWAIIGMVYSCFFAMGICLLSGISYALLNWRTICMVTGGLTGVVLVLLCIFVPESPRWLYSTGKFEKSEKILRKLARRNGKDQQVIHLSPPVHYSDIQTHTIVDLLRHKTLGIWLLAMVYIWFTNAFVYYGLTFDASMLSNNLYIGLVLSGVIEIPAVLVCIYLMEVKWIGRKRLLMFLSLFCGITCIVAIFLMHIAVAKLVLGLAAKLAIAASFAMIYIYSAEIFPTPLRSVAIGTSSTFARVGAIVSPFVSLLSAKYLFTVFGVLTLLSFLVTLKLPRTLGKPIPQTIEEVVGSNPTYATVDEENDSINCYDVDPSHAA